MWKKLSVVGMAILLCLGVGLFSQPGEASASGATYYVAVNGNDVTGDGSITHPWRTIQKAASVMVAGDMCLIREGVYRETVTPAHSGNGVDGPITFRNYNGESVTVSGADPVTGWSEDTTMAGSVYEASMSWSLGTGNQIFVDGVMMDEARWPNNAGSLLNPTRATMQAGSNTTVTDSALPGSTAGYYVGATLWAQSGSEWASIAQEVTGYNAATKTLTITSRGTPNASYDPKAGNRYYLFGLKKLLDAEKEWWYDESGQTLYLWSPGGADPTGSEVEAKARAYGFDFSGKTHLTLDGVNLFATSLHTDANSGNIIVTNMKAEYVSHNIYPTGNPTANLDNGINLYGSHNEISNSELAYSSAGLLSVNGTGSKVTNSYLRDANYAGTWSGGMTVDGSSMHVAYNTILNTGRGSITSRANLAGSLIEHNEFGYAGLLTKDGGMVYFNNFDGMQTEIRYNKIHDIASHLGIGIYLDSYNSILLSIIT